MATKKPETRLQRRIVKALKKHFPGSWWVKFHGGLFSAVGIPDLLGCVHGRFFAFEIKCPGKLKTLSKVQAAVIRQLQRAGAIAAAVTSVEEALALVETFAPAPKDGRLIRIRIARVLAGIRAEDGEDLDHWRNYSSKKAA